MFKLAALLHLEFQFFKGSFFYNQIVFYWTALNKLIFVENNQRRCLFQHSASSLKL